MKITLPTSIIALCLSAAGCAPTTPVEKQAYTRYVNCLVAKARQVDDKRSDALSIATAIQNTCTAELEPLGYAPSQAVKRDAALNAVLYARNHP